MPLSKQQKVLAQLFLAATSAVGAIAAWELSFGQQRSTSTPASRLRAAATAAGQSVSTLSQSTNEEKFINQFATTKLPSLHALAELVILATRSDSVLQYVVRKNGTY
jgi:hypothetical protein